MIKRGVALFLQKLAHQTLGCCSIASALHQNIKNENFLIDNMPILPLRDRQLNLIVPSPAVAISIKGGIIACTARTKIADRLDLPQELPGAIGLSRKLAEPATP